MRLGKVIGKVTLSLHDPAYTGGRWLLVSPATRAELAGGLKHRVGTSPSLVVYDNLGAAAGDVIGFVEGGEAAAPFAKPTPVDAYNFALIEKISYTPRSS